LLSRLKSKGVVCTDTDGGLTLADSKGHTPIHHVELPQEPAKIDPLAPVYPPNVAGYYDPLPPVTEEILTRCREDTYAAPTTGIYRRTRQSTILHALACLNTYETGVDAYMLTMALSLTYGPIPYSVVDGALSRFTKDGCIFRHDNTDKVKHKFRGIKEDKRIVWEIRKGKPRIDYHADHIYTMASHYEEYKRYPLTAVPALQEIHNEDFTLRTTDLPIWIWELELYSHHMAKGVQEWYVEQYGEFLWMDTLIERAYIEAPDVVAHIEKANTKAGGALLTGHDMWRASWLLGYRFAYTTIKKARRAISL